MNYDREESNVREINGFTITRTDPYGFWVVSNGRKRVPFVLQGHFTSITLINKAIQAYLNAVNKDKEKVA